jgi:hypothetical protein
VFLLSPLIVVLQMSDFSHRSMLGANVAIQQLRIRFPAQEKRG